MGDPFDKVVTGEPLEIPATTWNYLLESAQDYRRKRLGKEVVGPLTEIIDPANLCLVKAPGASTDTLAIFSILAYNTASVLPATYPYQVRARPAFDGIAPTDTAAPFCITIDALHGAQFGRAVAAGLAVCKINVSDSTHTRAVISSGVTDNLVSAAAGGVPIVYKESGTGLKWAIVLLGDPSTALRVREVDGSPSVFPVSILEFDQADGFTVSNPSAGVARVDLTTTFAIDYGENILGDVTGGSAFSITSDSTWIDTGLTTVLTGAGYWELFAVVASDAQVSNFGASLGADVRCRLYNVTAGAAVANSEFRILWIDKVNTADVWMDTVTVIVMGYHVTGGDTIRLEVQRSAVTTWGSCVIDARSKIGFHKLA